MTEAPRTGPVRKAPYKHAILMAGEPSADLASRGISLRSWPGDPEADRWPTMELGTALFHKWQCDAHITGYATRGDTLPRLASQAIGTSEVEEVRMCATFLDFDRPGHEPWPSQDIATETLTDMIEQGGWFSDAYALYTTRAGIRAVYVLAQPVPLALADSWVKPWHAAKKEALASILTAFVLEWDDSANQWSRHFRLPYVLRDGVPTDPFVWCPGNILANTLEGLSEREPITLSTRGAPYPPDPPPKGWQAWVSAGSKAGPYVDLLSAGLPWGPPHLEEGTRNSTLKTVSNSLAAQLFKGRAPPRAEDIYAIVAPSVIAATEHDAVTLAEAWRFASWAAASALQRDNRPEDTPIPSGEPPAPPDATRGATEAYPPLLACGKFSYLLAREGDTYKGPYEGAALYLAIRDEACQDIPTYKSPTTLRTVTEIQLDSGCRAEEVELVYPGVRRGAVWDPVRRRAIVRVLQEVAIEPAYNARCAEWLASLVSGCSDDVRAAFYTWLGTCHLLDRPTCALYLEGPPGKGKGLLAAAIAHMWGCGPIGLAEALTGFNAGLRRNPVAYANEGIVFDRAASERFRDLLGELNHRIEEKFQPRLTLYGCPRVIMCANHGSVLAATGAHGARDVSALIVRILHVRIPEDALELELPETKQWIIEDDGTPGALMRHLAYLRGSEDARDATLSGRFLVQGIRTEYHTRLVTGDPLYGGILLCIAVALTRITEVGGPGVTPLPEQASVLVSPSALHTRWRRLSPDEAQRPSLPTLTKALRSLGEISAGGVGDTHGVLVHRDYVLQCAEDAGIEGLGMLRASLGVTDAS